MPARLECPTVCVRDPVVGDQDVDVVERWRTARARRRSCWSPRARRRGGRWRPSRAWSAASSRSGVESPWPTVMPLVPMKATSARSRSRAATVSVADRGLRRAADPARQQVQLDCRRGRRVAPRRDRVGDDGQPAVAGEQAGEPHGGGAGVEEDRAARGRQQVEGRWRDPVLLRGVGDVALGRGRTRATVRASAGTAPPCTRRTRPSRSRDGQVAAYGLGGDVVLVGELGDRHPARWVDQCAMACWRSSAYMVTASPPGRICVCVVLRPNLLTVKAGIG